MKRTLSILAVVAAVFAAQIARADEPVVNQTYAALSGVGSSVTADVDCCSGNCFAQQAAADGLGLNLGGLAGIHGSVTYRVRIKDSAGGTDYDNLMGYELSFCQPLFPGVMMLVEIGTGGSFNHPLDAFNDFYNPDHVAQKARLKQAYLHIN